MFNENQSISFCKLSCASKAAFKLKSGAVVIFDFAPFVIFLEEFSEISPQEISASYTMVMDLLVEGYSLNTGVEIVQVQTAYAWLKCLRDVTKLMSMKVIAANKFEEMTTMDITKDELYRAG